MSFAKLFSSKQHVYLFCFFGLCAVFLIDFLPIHWSNDSKTVLAIAAGDISSEGAGGYYITAQFFGFFGGLSIIAIMLIGYIWARESSYYLDTQGAVYAYMAISLPGILMGMVRPQKDAFTGIFVASVLFFARRYNNRLSLSFALIATAYLIYSLSIRPYFLIIFTLSTLAFILKKYVVFWRLSFIFIGFLAVLFLPSDLLILLQGSRDEINISRGVDEEQRTAFVNIYPQIQSSYEFFVNYIHAFVRLNLPLAYHFDIQSFVLQAYVFFYYGLLFFGLAKVRNGAMNFLLILFFCHILFLPLIEPDLGSYLRHISGVSAFLLPIINILFKNN